MDAKKLDLIYNRVNELLAQHKKLEQERAAIWENPVGLPEMPASNDEEFYLDAMLVMRQYDGVSGPLYLYIKSYRDIHSRDRAVFALKKLLEDLERFEKPA